MAGKGNPVIVRINNGNYTPAGARNLSVHMLRAAYQMATASGHVDAFLAETDTCPQNRYSTGAHSLHSHFTATILEGASGAKHWITRLSSHEPESGEAYRRLLSRYSGFYHTLSSRLFNPSVAGSLCHRFGIIRITMPGSIRILCPMCLNEWDSRCICRGRRAEPFL